MVIDYETVMVLGGSGEVNVWTWFDGVCVLDTRRHQQISYKPMRREIRFTAKRADEGSRVRITYVSFIAERERELI